MATETQHARHSETPRSIALSSHRTPGHWLTRVLRRARLAARWLLPAAAGAALALLLLL